MEKVKKILVMLSPLLGPLLLLLVSFKQNFKPNGAHYEFLFRELVLFYIITIVIQIVVYFISNKITKNKIFSYMMMLVAFGIIFFPHYVWFILAVLFYFFAKKFPDVCEAILVILSFMFVSLILFNSVPLIIQGISYCSRRYYYDAKEVHKTVEEKENKPNIYWMHVDGMPNIDFIEKYYQKDLSSFKSFLDENQFSYNLSASFHGGHHTLIALNALLNPVYYDEFLGDYTKQLDQCLLENCYTDKVPDFWEVTERRFHNELFGVLEENQYDIVTITEFNHYTSFSAKYVYDIRSLKKNSEIAYFENHYTDKEFYRYLQKNHVMDLYANMNNNSLPFYNPFVQESIPLSHYDSYPTIEKSKYLSMRAFLDSIEDSKKRSDKPKFYFLDNTLCHVNWYYDEDGAKKKADDYENLDFVGDTYVYSTKLIQEFIEYIRKEDPNSILIIQADHGIHTFDIGELESFYSISKEETLNVYNSTFNAVYIPEEMKNGEEDVLLNPLNISRYLMNYFVEEDYPYLPD